MLAFLLNLVGGTKAIPALIGAAVMIAVGAGAAETYEHKVPWGLGPKLSASINSIPGKVADARAAGIAAGVKAQSDTDAPAFAQWADNLKQCRADRDAVRQGTSAAISRAEANTSAQVSAAYQLGRAVCGATNELSPAPSGPNDPAGSGDVPTGSVPTPVASDLGDLVNAAAHAPR